MTISNSCPICGRCETVFALCSANGYFVYGCQNCGAEHVFPRPDQTELKAYYDREQWYESGESGGYQNYDKQTAWSVDVIKPLLEECATKPNMSILDIGCGYGAHLELAANMGWKCFGIELSDHAREIAKKRLGASAYIVENVVELIPHAFDVVLMLDVIEHLPEPYSFFYSLFSIGAITTETQLIITTPNAGSSIAQQNPSEWVYRHPPSHLLYYCAETLRYLLAKLHFRTIHIRGLHPLFATKRDELTIADYGGLEVLAKGSDFTEFMRERYVPGTWSKIAEYEHLPRYELAQLFVKDKKVLDFGCGTGYGANLLADQAISVVGLDISKSALAWAEETHRHSRLSFHQSDNLGAELQDRSFDVITCFEMIEHVDHETQQGAITNFARLLSNEGLLIISTPNPETTKLYGANPYHLREMTLLEFGELLGKYFLHIHILEQRVRDSITFDPLHSNKMELKNHNKVKAEDGVVPLAFIAICSNHPIKKTDACVFFGEKVNPIQDFLARERQTNEKRFESYQYQEQVGNLSREVGGLHTELQGKDALLEDQRNYFNTEIDKRDRLNAVLLSRIEQGCVELQNPSGELRRIMQTRWFRLREVLLFHPIGMQKLLHLVCIVGGGLMPQTLRRHVSPQLVRRLLSFTVSSAQSSVKEVEPYRVKFSPIPSKAHRVLHVIANFMTGGSSRLVVDLVENLGSHYQHSVLTGFSPSPPTYVGITVDECRFPNGVEPFIEHYKRIQPDFVHVHYWGDCDEPWYAKAIESANMLNLPVIENINTPTTPYLSKVVKKYIYVSDYVRRVFGIDEPHHITIYPGSNFGIFTRSGNEHAPEDCVGMVYRLEQDKLNEEAILPFIRIAQLRPRTKVLIVGGGSLLEYFKMAVQTAGVLKNFEFTGYVAYEILPDLYRRMSLFIAPVWKESFGQVSPFAMSMKVPVIGYDVGAIHEIVGSTECMVPAGDANALANLAVRLLDAPNECRVIGADQQQRAQARFSVQAMVDCYADIYAEIASPAHQEQM